MCYWKQWIRACDKTGPLAEPDQLPRPEGAILSKSVSPLKKSTKPVAVEKGTGGWPATASFTELLLLSGLNNKDYLLSKNYELTYVIPIKSQKDNSAGNAAYQPVRAIVGAGLSDGPGYPIISAWASVFEPGC